MSNPPFASAQHEAVFEDVLSRFLGIGYDADHLFQRDWGFDDWFALDTPKRTIPAALFGRFPPADDTAVLGITRPGEARGAELANRYRALGAPFIVEVEEDRIGIWGVAAEESDTRLLDSLPPDGFAGWLEHHRRHLEPAELLRTKNLRASGPVFFQQELFAGLMPELEDRIASILGPRLEAAFRAGSEAYYLEMGRLPREEELFRAAFWLLTGKVFADRQHELFRDLAGDAGPDEVLRRVGDYYGQSVGDLLTPTARQEIFRRVWSKMDFQNLSVEALSQLWSETLVTEETRRRLGIHRTRRSIVRYIVDRIPFERYAPNERFVLEPCTGSAAFLIGAMDRMREPDLMPGMDDATARHTYFKRLLWGFEKDPFGMEIGRLCLSLADYPNPNGWQIKHADVFTSPAFANALAMTRVVLCNPPFERFGETDFTAAGAATKHLPAELLKRVLDHLHPDGVLGFVLPRIFIDHSAYKDVRRRLTSRFGAVEVVAMPDKGWGTAQPDTALLIATEPGTHNRTVLSCGVVPRPDWEAFDWLHVVPTREILKTTPEQAAERIPVPILRAVWEHLGYCRRLGEIAAVHKGVEWEPNLEDEWDTLVGENDRAGWFLGVRPRPKNPGKVGIDRPTLWQYQVPPLAYLNFAPKYQRRPASFARAWDKPKVIFARGRASRGPWRTFAFADARGLLACPESFLAVWPKDERLIYPLTAVLNGPVANAFISSHGDKPHTALGTLRSVPVPYFTEGVIADLNRLVPEYADAAKARDDSRGDRLLREIDATVLDAYRLPPRLQRSLLDYFNPYARNVPFPFGPYFDTDSEACYTLREWIDGRFRGIGLDHLLESADTAPTFVRETLRRAVEADRGPR